VRNAFIKEVTILAQRDSNIIMMLADNGIIVFDDYAAKLPEQLVNVGIAESNLISMASGMATCGLKPFVYSIIPFLTMRPFEFIRNDICYQNKGVRLVGIGAGFAYSALGPTHHAIEDIALMNVLPNITIISPADPIETKKVTRFLYDVETPVYVRLGTGHNPDVYNDENYNFQAGKGVVLRSGGDLTLIGTGTILASLVDVAQELSDDGINVELVNIHTLKPFDRELIVQSVKKTKRVITVEEHFIVGGLGSIVGDVLISDNIDCKFKKIGVRDRFVSSYGSLEYLRSLNGLDKDSIKKEIMDIL